MANQATKNTLTASVRSRLNLVNMSTVTDTEIKGFLNDSLAALWELMTSRWRDYYVKTSTISLIAKQEGYTLPTDFRAASAVFAKNSSSSPVQRIALRPFNMNEFAAWGPGIFATAQLPLMYRIMGGSIYFTPVPGTSTSNAIELWYVPQWSAPASDDTTIDNALPNGWELWVVHDTCVAITMRMRQPDAAQLFMAEREKVEKRLIAAASIRDETPQQMVDVYSQPSRFTFE